MELFLAEYYLWVFIIGLILTIALGYYAYKCKFKVEESSYFAVFGFFVFFASGEGFYYATTNPSLERLLEIKDIQANKTAEQHLSCKSAHLSNDELYIIDLERYKACIKQVDEQIKGLGRHKIETELLSEIKG